MVSNNYLDKQQRATIADWLATYQGEIVRIRDRSCNYREVTVEWSRSVNFPAFNKTAIVVYEALLDLTPSGKIRVETHGQKQVSWHDSDWIPSETQLALPLPETLVLPPPPPDIERRSLYPRDRTQVKVKQKRPIQYSLPLDKSSSRLNEISIKRGNPVEARETIWAERSDYLDLDGRTIRLPKVFIELMLSMNCSISEFEAIAQFYQVMPPKAVLQIIESIPEMRLQAEFSDFQEPVRVEGKRVQKIVQSQSVGESITATTRVRSL